MWKEAKKNEEKPYDTAWRSPNWPLNSSTLFAPFFFVPYGDHDPRVI